MDRKGYLTAVVLAIILTTFVNASEESYIFIIDETGQTTLKYQIALTTEYGYFIPAQTTELAVPSEATDVIFFDSYGAKRATYLSFEDGFDIYSFKTRDVEYDRPYEFGYTYNLENATVQYRENFHFEYPTITEEDAEINFYFCIPRAANGWPVDYDYTNSNQYNTIKYAPQIETISISKLYEIKRCPAGYEEIREYDYTPGISTEVDFDFSIPGAQTTIQTYNYDNIKVNIPLKYSEIVDSNIPQLTGGISTISSKYSMNTLDQYRLTFLSDSDAAFESEEDSVLSATTEGDVYYKVGLLREQGQFFQVNLLSGIVKSAIMNTYGEDFDNWWSDGVAAIVALDVMDHQKVPTDKVKEVLKDAKTNLATLPKYERREIMSDTSVNNVATYAAAVSEMETLCPGHIAALSNAVSHGYKSTFTEENQFNNFLILQIHESCEKDASKILDWYGIEYDDVLGAESKLISIEDKYETVNLSNINQLKDTATALKNARNYFEQGKITRAVQILVTLDAEYEITLQKATYYTLRNNLDEKITDIPPEVRSNEIIAAAQMLGQAESAANSGDYAEANKMLVQAKEIYHQVGEQGAKAYDDYIKAKSQIEEMSLLQAFPSGMLAESSISKAETLLKEGNYEGANKALATSKFWEKTSWWLAIIAYGAIIFLLVLVNRWRSNKQVSANKKYKH